MPGSTEELHKLNDKINTLTSVRGHENASAAEQASHSSLEKRLPRNQVYTEVEIHKNPQYFTLPHGSYRTPIGLLDSDRTIGLPVDSDRTPIRLLDSQ